jgi:hypothetical protein
MVAQKMFYLLLFYWHESLVCDMKGRTQYLKTAMQGIFGRKREDATESWEKFA